MVDISPNHETNIAAVFRELAANSDKVTGKILKKIDKLAKKGEYQLTIEVDSRTSDYVNGRSRLCPPLVEKLKGMGFSLKCESKWSGWANKYKDYLTITW